MASDGVGVVSFAGLHGESPRKPRNSFKKVPGIFRCKLGIIPARCQIFCSVVSRYHLSSLRGIGSVDTSYTSHADTSGTINEDDFPPGHAQYDDFHTIDWQRDIARDRMRHRFAG